MPQEPKPFFSIIVNCFNGETYLRETLQCVLDQTWPHWELLFWDNRSTDNSRAILESFQEPRFQYFLSANHTSLGAARNLAAQNAKGDWIAFLDCDDLWFVDKLEKQAAIINEEGPELGLVYGRAMFLGGIQDGLESYPDYHGKPLPEEKVLTRYLMGDVNFIPCVSAVIKREVFWQVGGIPSDYFQAEDFYIFARIAENYRVRALQTLCCKIRVHSGNLSKRQRFLAYDELVRVLRAFRRRLSKEVGFVSYFLRLRRAETTASLYLLTEQRQLVKGLGRLILKGSPLYGWVVLNRWLRNRWGRIQIPPILSQ